jgi:hypothetical protein
LTSTTFQIYTIERLRISTIIMEPSSITDSKQAYLAAIAAPTLQEEGDDGVLGVWPVSFSGSRFAEQGFHRRNSRFSAGLYPDW